MKAKMKIKYQKAWLFITGVALLLALVVVMAIIFIFESHYGFAILCALIGIVILVALYFRFNYGITINEKRVVVIEQMGIKILRYDDIRSIIVKFTNEKIQAYIKMKNQQEHVFIWDYIYVVKKLFFSLENKIKLDNRFIEENSSNLSKCPKVKIQNFYTKPKK